MTAKDLVVGTLGAGFIGSFHSYGLAMQKMVRHRLPINLRNKIVVDLDRKAREEVADRFGYESSGDNWHAMLDDPEINLFINAAPNILHPEPTIKAAGRKLPVFCEKPLAINAELAFSMWKAAEQAGIVHQAGFVFRFIPAIRYMRELIRSGALGEPVHYRSAYLMSDYLAPDLKYSWRLDKSVAGTGTLGDLASHHIDVARFLVGEIGEVSAFTRINVPVVDGRKVDVDDSLVSNIRFDNGLIGGIQASRVAAGYGHFGRIEVDCTRGSLRFEVGDLNNLYIAEGLDQGFRKIQVIKPEHPLCDFWWAGGVQGSHPIGWVECFVHQMHHFLGAVIGEHEVAPEAATFRDGYRVAEVIQHMQQSESERRHVRVEYRDI